MFVDLARMDSNSKTLMMENGDSVRAAAFGLQSLIVFQFSKQVSAKVNWKVIMSAKEKGKDGTQNLMVSKRVHACETIIASKTMVMWHTTLE